MPQLYNETLEAYLNKYGFDPEGSNSTKVFFWGAKQGKHGIDNSCLSNHYIRKFTFEGQTFNSVEQGMMWKKAMLFNDPGTAKKILEEKWPPNQKRLGRQVSGFIARIWDQHKFTIVRDLCRAKFDQNNDLKAWLLKQPENVLFVEASPFDRIWGVELPDYAPEIKDIYRWRGENLLGFIHVDNYRHFKDAQTTGNHHNNASK
jgi:ribA/ribD-fused uncharacterized protein